MTQSDKKEEKNKETQKAEPASEKEKKLNRKVADKLKFYGVVTFLSLLCAGFIWFIFKPDTPETVEGTAGSIQRYPTLSHRRRWPTNRRLTNWKK